MSLGRHCCSPAQRAVCGSRHNAPLAARWTASASSSGHPGQHVLRRTREARSRLFCSRSSPTSSAVEGILRSCAAGSQREMTYRTHPTTRRPSPSPCRTSGDDPAHRRPDARARDHDRRGRDLPPPCPASGTRRWAIRWAKPSRIGRYQAQRRARSCATVCLDLQAFRRLKAPRTPCFTRERSQVRNPPRPSQKVRLAGTS
jgi:hypothetical protein